VVEWNLDLTHPEPLAQQVDRETDFDAEAARQWQRGVKRVARQAALPGQRLGGCPAGGTLDTRAGQPHDQAVASACGPLRREGGDGHVGNTIVDRLDQRRRLGGSVFEVSVEEQQRAWRGLASCATVQFFERLRTAVHSGAFASVARVPDDHGTGVVGGRCCRVGRAVVDDQHLIDRG
jgi:hypothetical protein